MAGTSVYQDTPENLKSLQYGFDGTSAKVIALSSEGYQYIATDTGESISVTASNFDIRDLNNAQDNVLIYGTDGSDNYPLKTDDTGVLQVSSSRIFTSESENVTTTNDFTGSTARDISVQSSVTFFINNTGTNVATVKVQISPDNTIWIDDSSATEVLASSAIALGVSKFARYARISYKSTVTGQHTDLTIIYQSQT